MRVLRPNRVMWMAIGAALAYFFDPDNGSSRRAALAEKLGATRASTKTGPMGPAAPLDSATRAESFVGEASTVAAPAGSSFPPG